MTLKIAELKQEVIHILIDEKYIKVTTGASADVSPHSPPESEELDREKGKNGVSGETPHPTHMASQEAKPEVVGSLPVGGDPHVNLQIMHLQIEAKDREYAHQLAMKRMEFEKEVELKRLEVELARCDGNIRHSEFNVSKSLPLIQQFCDTAVEAWFSAFERIAKSHKWPAGSSLTK